MGTNISKNPGDINLDLTPKKVNISKDEFFKILDDMIIAFKGNHSKCQTEAETEAYCKEKLQQCITGYKPDGKVWHNVPGKNFIEPYDILRARLRTFHYDLDEKKMISYANNRSLKNIEKLADDYSKERKDKGVDVDEDFSRLTATERREMESFAANIKEDFPTLSTAVDDFQLKWIAYLRVRANRNIKNNEIDSGLTREIKEIVELMGISGRQRQISQQQTKSGTLEELSTRHAKTLEEYIDVEKDYILEELLLIRNKVRRGDLDEYMMGYWLLNLFQRDQGPDKVKIRTIDELEKYLKDRGVKLPPVQQVDVAAEVEAAMDGDLDERS